MRDGIPGSGRGGRNRVGQMPADCGLSRLLTEYGGISAAGKAGFLSGIVIISAGNEAYALLTFQSKERLHKWISDSRAKACAIMSGP